MSAPNPSRLDANQVLQGAFDEETGRIRTDAEATIVNADIDVALDKDEDSVSIFNSDGSAVNIATEETQELNRLELTNINIELDAQTVQLSNINSELDGQTAQLISANSSLDAIEVDTDAIRVATQSIDSKTPQLESGRVPVISDSVQSGVWNVNSYEVHPLTSTITSINSLTTNQIAVLANPNRKGLVLFKSGTGTAYVKLGALATVNDYTVQMTNNTVYELPFPCYTGRIDIIFSNTSGTLKITELE